mgnify:CR=1 FL=1
MKQLLLSFFLCVAVAGSGQTPVLQVPVGHAKSVVAVAYSPDQSFFYSGSDDALLIKWDIANNTIHHTFKGHKSAVYAVDVAPPWIISGDDSGKIILWNHQSGKKARQYDAHNGGVSQLLFLPGGQQFISTSFNGDVKIWSVERPDPVQVLPYQMHSIEDAVLSADGRLLLTGNAGGEGQLWRMNDISQPVVTFQVPQSTGIRAVAISPDGTTGYTGDLKGQVSAWNLSDGTMQDTWPLGGGGYIEKLFYLKDRLIAVCNRDDGASRLWDVLDARPLKNLSEAHGGHTLDIAISPDGQYLLSGSIDKTINQWTTTDWALKQRFKGHAHQVEALTIATDGFMFLARNQDGTHRLWDFGSGKITEALDKKQHAQTFGPEEGTLLYGTETGQLTLLDTRKHANQFQIQDFEEQDNLHAIAVHPEGTYLLTAGYNAHLRRADNQELVRTFDDHEDWITSKGLGFSPDGRWIITASWDGTARLYAFNEPDQPASILPNHNGGAEVVAFSPNSQYVLTRSMEDYTIYLWVTETSELLRTFPKTERSDWAELKFSRDSRFLFIPNQEQEIKAWDIQKGKYAYTLPGGETTALGVSPFTDEVVLGNMWETEALVYDVAQQKVKFQLKGHRSTVSSAKYTPDGRFILTTSWDNTIGLWDASNGQLIATLIHIDENDWAVTTPQGFFDASPNAMALMHYEVFKDDTYEVIELEQMKARYHVPGLLAKLYAGASLPQVQELDQADLFPVVEAQITGDKLEVSLTARDGGIGPVTVLLNGVEMTADANPNRQNRFTLDLTPYERFLWRTSQQKANTITVQAWNAGRWLSSPPLELTYDRYRSSQADGRGNSNDSPSVIEDDDYRHLDLNIHVLAVGTSLYEGESLRLTYPDHDAIAMARSLLAIGNEMLRNINAGETYSDRVQVHCLTSQPEKPEALNGTPVKWAISSKSNILARLQAIQEQARAEDIFVLYLSGHGLTYGSHPETEFHYMTKEAQSDNLSSAEVRAAWTLSGSEITEALNEIPALKKVMIVDACNSGRMVELINVGSRSLSNSQIRPLDRMKDRTGVYIISGSAPDRKSYESSLFGQGLLTYALLQGMMEEAVQTADGSYVDLLPLFQHARDAVPRLALNVGETQEPMMGVPKHGSSFDLGIYNERVQIPIGKPKPIISGANFVNASEMIDDLGFLDKMRQALLREHERGSNADFQFMEISPRPQGAYLLGGSYTKDAGQFTVLAKLFIPGSDVRIPLEVRPADNLDQLARYVVRAAKKALKK